MLTELYLSWSLIFLYLPSIIAVIFIGTYITVWAEFLLALLTSIFYIYKKPSSKGINSSQSALPGVSIVKPLMGADSRLEENLLSHFSLTYDGPFELLFCVEDSSDTALGVVERLQKKFPHVDTRIFMGPTQPIINPMVRNMVQGYDAAKYDLIWICTSRVKVTDDIMNDLVLKISSNSKMELVHQMPYFLDTPSNCSLPEPSTPTKRQQSPPRSPGQSPLFQGYPTPSPSPVTPPSRKKSSSLPLHKPVMPNSCSLGGAIEKIYFGTAVPRPYFFVWAIGQTCFTGMSYIFRKSSLDRSGGLAAYGKYLAEDFFIARALTKIGKQTISAYPALQNVGDTSLVALKDRLVRWMRLRINTIPFLTSYLEPMQECIPCGLAAGWAIIVHFQMLPYFSFISFFLLHIITWFLLEAILFHSLARCRTSIGFSVGYIFAWLLRQLLGLYVYFEAYLNPSTVRWGKGVYHLKFLSGEAVLHSNDRPGTPDDI